MEEWRYMLPFLTSALFEGEWSTSHRGRFTTGEKVSESYGIGGCVGPRARTDVMEERKIIFPFPPACILSQY
jgi:hypothetical protein